MKMSSSYMLIPKDNFEEMPIMYVKVFCQLSHYGARYCTILSPLNWEVSNLNYLLTDLVENNRTISC